MPRWIPLVLVGVAGATGCRHEIQGPKPSVTAIAPLAACNAQHASEIKISGDGMSPLPTKTLTGKQELVLPHVALVQSQGLDGSPAVAAVSVPDDATMAASSDVTWTDQKNMSFFVCPAGVCSTATPARTDYDLAPGLYAVSVKNKNDNPAAVLADTLTIVPPPTVTMISPDLLCQDKDNTFTLSGDFFLLIDGQTGKVTVGAGAAAKDFVPTLSDCRPLPSAPGISIQACKTATIMVPAKSFTAGKAPVVLTAPEPDGCHSTEPVVLTFVPEPAVTAIQPDLECVADAAQSLTITGTGFLSVAGALPSVVLDAGHTFPASKLDGCVKVDGPAEDVQTCTSLTFLVPKDGAPPAAYDVHVQNPKPADCLSTTSVKLTLLPPPHLTAVVPPSQCNAQKPTTLTLNGSGFLSIDGKLPTVAVGAMSFVAAGVTGCTAVTTVKEAVQSCTSLTVTIPAGALPTGILPVKVTNPETAECVSSETVTFDSTAPPTVATVAPTMLCRGGGTLTLTGTGFEVGMTTTLGGLMAGTTTVGSGTSATATFGLGLAPSATPYDLTVANPDGCSATKPMAVTVTNGPIVFFADPPVVYRNITTVVTVYGAGITKPTVGVTLTPAAGGAAIPLTIVDDSKPNRVQVVVPKLAADGDYDLTLTDSGPCPAVLPAAIKAVSMLTLTITGMTPSFGGTTTPTPSTIKGSGFAATPRAYLSPSSASSAATSLRSTAFIDGSTLTTVVPAGLVAGDYDLIVINPDGSVGVKTAAFKVTATAPPVITSVNPGTVPKTGTPTVTVAGSGFASGAAVSLRCVDSVPDPSMPVMTLAPVTAPGAATTDCPTASATCLGVSVPVGSLGGAIACVVRVTNPDGAFGEYSSLTLTNPSANINDFQTFASSPLNTARRALGAVAARGNAAARFIYAIGGDTGMASGALDTVEVASVDLFGAVGKWTVLPYKLPGKTTFVGATGIGRYIYVVGGHDGTKGKATAYRAVVQDPTSVVEVTDLDLAPGGGTGLPGGTFYYRVAAVMGMSDPENPNGETLASDPFVVTLPSFSDKLKLTLTWSAYPGAAGYRIYRSPLGGGGSGSEELVGTVTGGATTSFADTGAAGTGAKPLPVGSTTVWVTLASLGAARAGAGVTHLHHPANAAKAFIYAVGGLDDTGAAVNTTEYLTIDVDVTGKQTVDAVGWQATASLAAGKGRWQLLAFTADNDSASYVTPTSAFVYAGSGFAANGTTNVGDVDAFTADLATGALSARSGEKALSMGGYGGVLANNFIYAFGGGPTPAGTNVSGTICKDSGQASCSGGPPTLASNSWNSLGISIPSVYLPGSTLESSFIYLVGGATTTATSASAAVWYSIW